MKNTDNILSPAFGLFRYKGKYFYRNLIDMKIYLKRIHFLCKNGYSPVATWETFYWFTNWANEIIKGYIKDRAGTSMTNPYDNTELEDGNEADKIWDKYFSEMQDCLKIMKEYEEVPFSLDSYEEMYKAKDKFFEMFSNVFYSLWD